MVKVKVLEGILTPILTLKPNVSLMPIRNPMTHIFYKPPCIYSHLLIFNEIFHVHDFLLTTIEGFVGARIQKQKKLKMSFSCNFFVQNFNI